MSAPILHFDGIEKSFFGVKVLKEVTFSIPAGQTLGLVGENGAGKSTLMNILGGNLLMDSGRMVLDGRLFTPLSPREAERAGVAFIHQELNLFPNLSIAENLFIGGFPRRGRRWPLIDRATMRQRTAAMLGEVKLDHLPETPVDRLAAGERQLVEIAKALSLQARLIILDEPTTSLTDPETRRLFEIMRRFRERGIAMIYVSHNLDHVQQLADRIVVLRDGQVVADAPTAELPIARVVSLMVGREIDQFFPPRPAHARGEVLLDARGLSQPGIVQNVSFQLHQGEVLGISGLMGSGRSELARILFGLDACAKGDIQLGGRSLQGLSPRQRIRAGLAFLTEDRAMDGLCLEASIAENLLLSSLPRWSRVQRVDRVRSNEAVRQIRQAVRLTPTARDFQPVKTLSGGNQQKVVLGKWLLTNPKVFILDEPTRGIDIGAKQEVYGLINDLVAQGAGVLMISSELEELIGMCDRILVLRSGAIRDVLGANEFDRERILRAAVQAGEG